MKTLLGKLSPRRAVGIYLGEHEIALSLVAATVLGPVEIHRETKAYDGDDLTGALGEMLDRVVGKKPSKRRLVGFGLPTLRVFYSTRTLKATNVEVSSKVLLHEVLQSPNSNVDEMAIDRIDGSPGKRPIVSLAACRKKYLNGLLANMQECGVRPYRVEPTQCALLRAAEQVCRTPRKAKTVLRIFLGPGEGLALLTVSGWPLAPRSFEFTESDIAGAIVSNVRTLDVVGKLSGADSNIDSILIHGRPELREQTDVAALEKQLDVCIQWHETPGLDPTAIAYGVAMGCVQIKSQDFDLARSLKQRQSLLEIFPWAEASVQLVAVVCLALFLFHRSRELGTEYAALREQTQTRPWMNGLMEQQLTKQKQELEVKVAAIRKFLMTRIVWTDYTHDLPDKLPKNAQLNSFHGVCEMEKKGKNVTIKPKKSFTLRIGSPIATDGAAPKEIDAFLDSLRENTLLKRDFPQVELADIKWYQPFIGAQPTAFFTVVCLPKATAPGDAAGHDKGKAGH